MKKYYHNQPLNILIITKNQTYDDYIDTEDNISSFHITVCVNNNCILNKKKYIFF